jgi:hypothetical protein
VCSSICRILYNLSIVVRSTFNLFGMYRIRKKLPSDVDLSGFTLEP